MANSWSPEVMHRSLWRKQKFQLIIPYTAIVVSHLQDDFLCIFIHQKMIATKQNKKKN